ncbi:MAG: hypothetical protein VR78_11060 [Hoeflea sp. BRH_c9]|nr:MAG: hypothetical protein VR78_11060 [Hoeflea sp. BRH_c9]
MSNKDRFDTWFSLYPSKTSPIGKNTTILRNIAEINRLEDLCILNMHSRDEATIYKLEDSADLVCKIVFGVSPKELRFDYPDGYFDLSEFSDERIAIDKLWDDYDGQFDTRLLTDDETVGFFVRYNIDFRNERGQPLLCTRYISLAAEAAAKGIAGTLPDLEKVSEQAWEHKLAADAAQFKRTKGKQK